MNEEINIRIAQLNGLLADNPLDEQLWLERAKLYWKLQDWQHCIEDYDRAIALNPCSQALELKRMATDTIAYYYKEQFKP